MQKIFVRVIQRQIGGHAENVLSPFLCGCRKGFIVQYALLSILAKWRIYLGNKGYSGEISKAFDTLNH